MEVDVRTLAGMKKLFNNQTINLFSTDTPTQPAFLSLSFVRDNQPSFAVSPRLCQVGFAENQTFLTLATVRGKLKMPRLMCSSANQGDICWLDLDFSEKGNKTLLR